MSECSPDAYLPTGSNQIASLPCLTAFSWETKAGLWVPRYPLLGQRGTQAGTVSSKGDSGVCGRVCVCLRVGRPQKLLKNL